MTFGELYYCSDKKCHFNLYVHDTSEKPIMLWSSIKNIAPGIDGQLQITAKDNDELFTDELSILDVVRFTVTPVNSSMCLMSVYVRKYKE